MFPYSLSARTAAWPGRAKPLKSKRRIPRQARAGETVEPILEAAAQVLEAGGLAGFTTNAVAERAGVSIGTLYQYFADKHAMLLALARAQIRRGLAAIAMALRGDPLAPGEQRVRAMVRAMVNAFGGRQRARTGGDRGGPGAGRVVRDDAADLAFIAAVRRRAAPALTPRAGVRAVARADGHHPRRRGGRAAVLQEQAPSRTRWCAWWWPTIPPSPQPDGHRSPWPPLLRRRKR